MSDLKHDPKCCCNAFNGTGLGPCTCGLDYRIEIQRLKAEIEELNFKLQEFDSENRDTLLKLQRLKTEFSRQISAKHHPTKHRGKLMTEETKIKFAQKALAALGEAYRHDWSDFDGRTLRTELEEIAGFLNDDSHPPPFKEWLISAGIVKNEYGYNWND